MHMSTTCRRLCGPTRFSCASRTPRACLHVTGTHCGGIRTRNPPFGTRVKGADMDFLRAAARVARTAIYSLHKVRAAGVTPCPDARPCGADSPHQPDINS